VVFVHGGPGGGTEAAHRQYFDPRAYRIILFDQRGCGKSTPHAELRDNTTWDLVSDMERLRTHLGIERWQVFGGSWGSTLSLAYAQTHAARVTELVLRGIFLVREQEIRWFYQFGASEIFPDAWEAFEAPIPQAERGDFVSAYYQRLTSEDAAVRREAAIAWSTWEGRTTKLLPAAEHVAHFSEGEFALAFARIECHYFMHKAWIDQKGRGQLLEGIDKIRHIPAAIVQGRYDACCPPRSAWDLHKAWPEADFQLVPDAGHAAGEPGISRGLVAATDRFAGRTSSSFRTV
jgi:proline iminopeptidase